MNKEKLEELCKILEKVVVKIAGIYNDNDTNLTQKALLETIIGAAIWYLPGSNELYSGNISKKAEEKLKEGVPLSKLTKEHRFPRKQAGRELLSLEYTNLLNREKKLRDLYMEKYGKFNLVLSKENKDLIKFQRSSTFIDDETSYQSANIELVKRSIEQLRGLPINKTGISEKRENSSTAKAVKGEFEILPEILNEDDEKGNSFTGISIKDQSLVENSNPNRCYTEFMNHVITNFSGSINKSVLLSHFIRTDRNDKSFGPDLKYPSVIKSSGNFFFSSHASKQIKKRRIINIANELGIQIRFLY